MKCSKCKGRASIELRRHHVAYCKPDYLEFFDNQVERAIHKQRMFKPDDRIMVGVSGGKDSLTLWDFLLRMEYDVTALHIHLGIGEYSNHSHSTTVKFAEERGAPLITVDLAERYGRGRDARLAVDSNDLGAADRDRRRSRRGEDRCVI